MYKFFNEHQNASAVLDYVMYSYKKSFLHLVISNLVLSFASGIISVILMLLSFIFILLIFGAGIISTLNSESDILAPVIGVSSIFFIFILLFLVTLRYLASATNIFFSKQIFYGEKLSYNAAFSFILKSLKNIFLFSVVHIFIYIIEIIFVILAYVALFYYFLMDFSFDINSLDGSTFTAFSISLLILTFISIFTLFAINSLFILALPAALFEKRIFFGAFARSYQLVTKDYKQILGLRFIIFLILYAIYYSIILIFEIIPSFLNIFLENDMLLFSALFPLVSTTISSMVYYVIFPIISISNSTIYFKQRIKYEGLDIESGANELMANELSVNSN